MKINRKNNEGVVLIWVAFIMLVLVFFAALVIDTGYVVVTRGQLQTSADAAALAGAQWVKQDQVKARERAVFFGLANRAASVHIQLDPNVANVGTGDIVLGIWNSGTRTFTPDVGNPNAVKVVARRTDDSPNGAVQSIMATMMDNAYADTDVRATAIATLEGGFGAGVIALNPDQECAFSMSGTPGTFSVDNGAIYVNSDSEDAACHAGKPTVEAEGLYVGGGVDHNWDKQINYDGEVYPDSDPIADPLADLPEPTYNPAADLGTVEVSGAETVVDLTPGFYSGGITQHGGQLNLAPGVYVVAGAGFQVNGNSNLLAEGVMIYILEGPLKLEGTGTVILSPPDTSEYTYAPSPDITPYAESLVSIFQARHNDSPSSILGTSDSMMEGTMYFPAAELEIGGESQTFGNGLIADTIWVHGTGEINIDYLGQFGVIPGHVYLVD
jgi:Flp pilus assembly protein TadG